MKRPHASAWGIFMPQPTNWAQQLRLWADELRAIANEGLHWGGDNPYNQHRFSRVRRIAAELFSAQSPAPADVVEQYFTADALHLAPYPAGDAAIFNTVGEILLIQRRDDQLWAMPGGGFEVGETPAEATCREAWEETGMAVEPLRLVGVYDSRLCGSRTEAHLYQFVLLCRPRDAHTQPTVSNETLDVRWYAEGALPPLSPGHATRIADAFRCWHDPCWQAVFDTNSTQENNRP
ncbi:MAG TPA: NUDIX hydrolase N-terminal domain-containing protein [Kouleothrix sp.]|nr:NUDIX hydrolase N-terminal domain-containing protein [Kouleothrix sp.]